MSAEPAKPEPDVRVLQANERTLLAWIRTGLALMAFGFVLARVGAWLRSEGESLSNGGWWLGATFILIGTLCNSSAAVRYWRIHRALVQGRRVVPGGLAAVSLALGVTILGLLLGTYVLLR